MNAKYDWLGLDFDLFLTHFSADAALYDLLSARTSWMLIGAPAIRCYTRFTSLDSWLDPRPQAPAPLHQEEGEDREGCAGALP